MPEKFLLPDPGEGIHEADIVEIHVSPGDEVRDGDALFTVETDKAVVDIPSSFDGEIVEVNVETGETVEVGEVLLTYEPSDTQAPGAQESDEAEDAGEANGTEETEQQGEEETEQPDESEASGEPVEDEEKSEESDEKPSGEKTERVQDRERPVPASPATRSLAKRLDVDLHDVEGSGPDGRIEPEDVQAAADQREERRESGADQPEEPSEEKPELEEHGPVDWVDLRSVRRATARQMTRSWREIPHVTHQDVADITGLEAFRRAHAEDVEADGGKLTITPFLIKAAAAALAEHPRFNASLDPDDNRLALKRYYNIGVAVDTDDGLIVPVIEDVDAKSIAELAVELTQLADRMREGDRSLEDMKGGTFTITNPGGIGGTGFTPIINHPQVAILGAARARHVPVVTHVESANDEDGRSFEMAARLHLPLVLAFDHRVNDGADAARFMNTVKGLLEDFSQLVLYG